MNNNQNGRSMIEMLGVLAIIGVLSVGAIAGYSVAMEKYKLNKFINEQTYLINGLIQYDGLRKLATASHGSDYAVHLGEYIKKLELIPSDTKISQDVIYLDFISLALYVRNSGYVITYILNDTSRKTFDTKICAELISNLAIPLKGSLKSVSMYGGNYQREYFYGDTTCTQGQTCLKDITKTQIHNLCSQYTEDRGWKLVFDF